MGTSSIPTLLTANPTLAYRVVYWSNPLYAHLDKPQENSPLPLHPMATALFLHRHNLRHVVSVLLQCEYAVRARAGRYLYLHLCWAKGLLYSALLIAALISIAVIFIFRVIPFRKGLTVSILFLFFCGMACIVFIALIGPAIGDRYAYAVNHIESKRLNNHQYALARITGGIMEADAFVIFECDRFMIRCKELHSENIFYLAMNHFHTDKLSARLSTKNDAVELLINNESLFTYQPQD